MSHFSKKSLIFYGTAIGSVVTLFSFISRYGERYLHPPASIGGDYLLKLVGTADCPVNEDLVLDLEQSGIYLGAAIQSVNTDAAPTIYRKLTLDGQFREPQITLTGTVPDIPLCDEDVDSPVSIKATVNENGLDGELVVEAVGTPIAFQAQRQAPAEATPKSSSH